MQTTINERLKILLDALGTNPNALAKVLGLGQSTVRNYIDRESKPGYEVLEKLYHSYEGINLPWLFGDPGEPLLSGVAEKGAIYQTAKNNRGGQVIGRVGRDAINHSPNAAEQAKMQQEIEFLRSQVAEKERTIQILLKSLPK